jgi:hypothetical protein
VRLPELVLLDKYYKHYHREEVAQLMSALFPAALLSIDLDISNLSLTLEHQIDD